MKYFKEFSVNGLTELFPAPSFYLWEQYFINLAFIKLKCREIRDI